MVRLAHEEGMIARAVVLLALVGWLPLAPTAAAAHEHLHIPLGPPTVEDCIYVDLSQAPPDAYVAPC